MLMVRLVPFRPLFMWQTDLDLLYANDQLCGGWFLIGASLCWWTTRECIAHLVYAEVF